MKTKAGYYIKENKKTKNFIVHDEQSEIKVHHENGKISKGTLVAGFKTLAEAEKFVDRMVLRRVWGK